MAIETNAQRVQRIYRGTDKVYEDDMLEVYPIKASNYGAGYLYRKDGKYYISAYMYGGTTNYDNIGILGVVQSSQQLKTNHFNMNAIVDVYGETENADAWIDNNQLYVNHDGFSNIKVLDQPISVTIS